MEFVKVKYPRRRRVVLDGDDFTDTNLSFEVERGTHSFAVDEPTIEGLIVAFIELTSQQAPHVLTFTPAVVEAEVTTRGLTRGAMPAPKAVPAPRARRPKTPKKRRPKPKPPAKRAQKPKAAKKRARKSKPAKKRVSKKTASRKAKRT